MGVQERRPSTDSKEAAKLNPLTITGPEAAEYVERMCTELAAMSDRAGLGFLAYLLEVAREEAALHCDPPANGPLVMHGELPPQA
ncbi:MAG: hypothetical protein AAGF49_00920 [Pseudomonadota bacterium]